MRLRRVVEGRPDALLAGKDDADADTDAEVLDEQEQDQVIERVLQDVLYKSQWNAVGMILLSGVLLLLLLSLLLLSDSLIAKPALPQLWLTPSYSFLRTLASLLFFAAYDNLSLFTHFSLFYATPDARRSPMHRGAQASSSPTRSGRDHLQLAKATTPTGLSNWLSPLFSSYSSSPAHAIQLRKEETRLDTLNTSRAQTTRKAFLIWLRIDIGLLALAWLLGWLRSTSSLGEDYNQSIGLLGIATSVLEMIISLGWMTLLELDESVPKELEELRKKRYAFKGA